LGRSLVVGFCPLLLGFTLRRWALPFVVGFYPSSLGSTPTLRRWVLPLVIGFCLPSLGSTPRCRGTLIDVVAPVLILSNRMAVVELIVVLGIVAGPWHSLCGGGGEGGCCVGLKSLVWVEERWIGENEKPRQTSWLVFRDASPPLDGVWWGFLCRIATPTPALGSPCPDVSTRRVSFSCSGCSLVLASRIAMRWVSSQCWGVVAVSAYRRGFGVFLQCRGIISFWWRY